ncbi:aromatase/cyclase [Streptomyces sp. 900105755]|uniref:aromatase/cyclase n=1 Tax=Streptomyces sp. Ag109_O5-10 TaxID=1855349 RepID=UPI00089DA0F0|nr:aromatase/cyclase [Streptomyces sp. Ag109_O5-10]SEE11016.1 aromatase [Streptomyces sp. Ag109_O5-10]
MSPRTRETEHSREVHAPADRLYALVADVSRWPVLLGPCVRARQIERDGADERIELWARTNGTMATWTSRRSLDPRALRISFRQDRSTAPVAAMSGEWSFRPAGEGRTRIVLTHAFTAVDDDPQALEWIARAVDRNSVEELAALGDFAERPYPLEQLVFSFHDRVVAPGADPADVYDFVYRCDLWPERLPHVGRVDLTEDPAGVQVMAMDTLTSDGRSHTTASVRLCVPGERISYKQTVLPALLSGHSGLWEFERSGGGTAIVSHHTVAVDPAAVARTLGAGATFEQACAHVRDTLGANSRATMEAACAYAASVVRRP